MTCMIHQVVIEKMKEDFRKQKECGELKEYI